MAANTSAMPAIHENNFTPTKFSQSMRGRAGRSGGEGGGDGGRVATGGLTGGGGGNGGAMGARCGGGRGDGGGTGGGMVGADAGGTSGAGWGGAATVGAGDIGGTVDGARSCRSNALRRFSSETIVWSRSSSRRRVRRAMTNAAMGRANHMAAQRRPKSPTGALSKRLSVGSSTRIVGARTL